MSLAPCTLSDDDLIVTIASIAGVERTATASLIAHLAELESRNLHLARGFRSLFGYCRVVLHCSEHEAYNRMEVVHAARRFPVILPLLARWFPSPDVPSSIRKLPTAAAAATAGQPAKTVPGAEAAGDSTAGAPAPTEGVKETATGSTTAPRPAPAAHRPVVAPLSADRYRLQVTLGEAAHDDLRCLQDLMRREIPNGDPAVIVARALKLLRQEAERKAFAATTRPRPAQTLKPDSRHIPAHVERAVWQRDEGQCAYEGPAARCHERSFLEFHHVRPWAVGGPPSVENVALRCAAHNAYEADVYFGPIRAAMAGRDDDSFRNESGVASG